MSNLQAAVYLQPENPEVWYELGLLYGEMGDFRMAEKAFRQAIQLNPKFARAHFNLALTLIADPHSKSDWPGAIAECREALKDQPDYAEAHNLLGAGLTEQGDLDDAILELQTAIQLKPSLAEAHFNLGIALERTGKVQEALQQYQAAVEAKGNYPEATVALAKLTASSGKTEEARRQLQNALRENPDLLSAHHALAAILRSSGDIKNADVEVRIAQDLSQRNENAIRSLQLSNQALQLAASGDFSAAAAALREAIALEADYGIPNFNLGLILADQGDLPGAVRQLEKAISLMPAEPKPWLMLGRIYLRLEEFQSASDALNWAAHLSPKDPTIRSEILSLQDSVAAEKPPVTLIAKPQPPQIGALSDTPQDHVAFAQVLIKREDFQGAIGELLRALALQPALIPERRQLAETYLLLGDFEHAELEYRKLLDGSPTDSQLHAALGHLFAKRGDWKRATEELQSALKYNPDSAQLKIALEKAKKAQALH